jgi:hypothetical protein
MTPNWMIIYFMAVYMKKFIARNNLLHAITCSWYRLTME